MWRWILSPQMHFLPIFVYVCFAFQSNMFWINEVSLLWFIQCSFNHLKKPNAICIHFLRSFSILCAIFAHEKRKIQKQPTDEPKTKASGEESNALYSKLSIIGAKNWKSISIDQTHSYYCYTISIYLHLHKHTNSYLLLLFFCCIWTFFLLAVCNVYVYVTLYFYLFCNSSQ